jgi:hypothetical protein
LIIAIKAVALFFMFVYVYTNILWVIAPLIVMAYQIVISSKYYVISEVANSE